MVLVFENEASVRLIDEDWRRLQRIGLLPEIKTPEAYVERVVHGLKDAHSWLAASEQPVPTVSTIQRLHAIAFREVHPWAGEFRPKGHEVMIGHMGCVDAKDIKKELLALTKEMKAEPFFGSHEYVSEVVAFYHSSFEAIHPFLDGNGRVGRIIMHRQMQLGLGLKQEATLSRNHYIGALRHAQQTGELEPFGRLLRRAVKTPQLSKGLEIG